MDPRFRRSEKASDARKRALEELRAAQAVHLRVEERLPNLDDAPAAELEDLLEDGYAQALSLERTCRSVARELAELRVDATDPDETERVRGELWAARRQLRELRSALATLKARIEEGGGD